MITPSESILILNLNR